MPHKLLSLYWNSVPILAACHLSLILKTRCCWGRPWRFSVSLTSTPRHWGSPFSSTTWTWSRRYFSAATTSEPCSVSLFVPVTLLNLSTSALLLYRLLQKQLAYLLGRQQIFLELDEDLPDCDELNEIMSNAHLNNNFLSLAREVSLTASQ